MKQFTPYKYLGHKLGRIHRNIDRYFDRHKDGAGPCLPRTQGMIIGFLMDNVERDIFQKDIEAHFDLKGATVTNMLKSLEKNGFIIRTPMENDARLKRITLTEKAYEREEKIRDNIRTIEGAMKKGFTDEEYRQLFSYIDRVIANMEELNS